MTQNLVDRFLEAIDKKQNPSVVGLDPRFEQIPDHLKTGDSPRQIANAFRRFNEQIIDATADIIPAVKPQSAFYEAIGSEGVRALEDTIQYAHDRELFVILDAKRNDIGSTAKAYADGLLSNAAHAADFLTVNPYLGNDGIEPFIEACKKNDKGIFILAKTSNKGSGQFQDREVSISDEEIAEFKRLGISPAENHVVLYNLVALEINRLAQAHLHPGIRGYTPIGAVVGATYPEQAEALRTIMHNSILLVPGYGTQGGGAKDVMPCFNNDGFVAVVNNSRGIIFAYQKKDQEGHQVYTPKEFPEASRLAAVKMGMDLRETLAKEKKLPAGWSS